MKMKKFKKQSGFSLAEAVTATALLSIVLVVYLTIQGIVTSNFQNFRTTEKLNFAAKSLFEQIDQDNNNVILGTNHYNDGNYWHYNANINGWVPDCYPYYSNIDLTQNTNFDPILSTYTQILINNLGNPNTGDSWIFTLVRDPNDSTKLDATIQFQVGNIQKTFTKIFDFGCIKVFGNDYCQFFLNQ
jgi:type II secretory pathway pseudopilin PulG